MIHRSKSLPSLGDLERPIDGYIRVSRVGDRSGESYISPEVQRRALDGWAGERGVELVVHEPEENVSGATMDRPVFNRIMRRIRDRNSGGIVVYKLDRFARTLVAGLTTLNELTDHRAVFASATEPLFDFTTADGRIFLQVSLMMAEYFRERTREGWEASLTYAVGRGVHIAPGIPYGYEKDDDKRLVPDASRAPHVLRAFELRVDGWPFQHIAEWLNSRAPVRDDGRAWSASSVERMIRRRVYLGVAHWGEQENRRAHPALVSEALWHAAQRRAQSYSKCRQSAEMALLHGIVRCAGCRFLMSRALNTSGGYRRHYYRCRVHRVSGICPAPAAVRADGADALEAYVESVVCAELGRRAGSYVGVAAWAALAAALADLGAAREDLETMRERGRGSATVARVRVVALASSPRRDGNSRILAETALVGAADAGHDVELLHVADHVREFLRDCRQCRRDDGGCSIDDGFEAALFGAFLPADAIVFATPVYWYGMSGQLKTFLDRIFCFIAASYPRADEVVAGLMGKRIALVLSAEESYHGAAAGILHQVQEYARYTHSEFVGSVAGYGNRRGDVRHDPSDPVGRARELGRRIGETYYTDYRIDTPRNASVWQAADPTV